MLFTDYTQCFKYIYLVQKKILLRLTYKTHIIELMVVLFGALAMVNCEPRQARKGATVVIDSGAEVWLFESPPITFGLQNGLSSSCA